MNTRSTLSLLIAAAFLVAGCGGSGDSAQSTPAAEEEGLTAEQLEHGIGPIDAFDPGPIDPALAKRGEQLYTTKCSACHKLSDRYVGPPLGDVTDRRSPAFVMNMILNPEEMIKEHPEGRKLYVEYMTPMANQSLSTEEARAILEYLRTQTQSN